MSRNGFSTAPRKARGWTSHLRQFSRTSAEAQQLEGPISGGGGGAPVLTVPPLSSSPPGLPVPPRTPDTISSSSTIREAPGLTTPLPRPAPPAVERTCIVTVNESFVRDDVLINLDHFDDGVQPGQLMAIDVPPDPRPGFSSLRRGTGRKDEAGSSASAAAAADTNANATAASAATTETESGVARRYLFTVKEMSETLKARHPSVQIYVAKHIADAFGMKKGSTVLLTAIDANNPAVEASHVELVFKDQYLSRADMWRMAVSELAERTVYQGQMVLFMNTIKAQVTNVYVEGQRMQSAFFGGNTRPIFRSESARYVLFIQMAREMWDFDSDGSGEIIFSKVVNGFLPALFKKWVAKKVKHLVTIVLFARVEYNTGLTMDLAAASVQHDYYTGVQSSGNRRPYKDFYRVVVSEMASGEWTRILHQLKHEFSLFRRDISLHHLSHLRPDTAEEEGEGGNKPPQRHIQAESSLAMYGNVLEAINMASSLYAHDYVDRDLMRTGISIAVITPGSGVFEVDFESLRSTTEALIGNGIGIDLVCVPRMPLHIAPLFRFRHPRYLERGLAKRPHPRGVHGHGGGLGGSTPKQTAHFGSSYASALGGSSLSPSRATDATITTTTTTTATPRGYASLPGDRFDDSWSYALPQWLHVSYWASEPGALLMRQGVPPPPMATLERRDRGGGGTDRTDRPREFFVRCRMYDLQMRGVLETNEIETTPLYMDPLFPRKAFRPSSLSSSPVERDGLLVLRSRLVPNVLYDPVGGFNRFAPDKLAKQDSKSLWRQLQEYDATRQKLPTVRRPAAATLHEDPIPSGPVSSTLRKSHFLEADPVTHAAHGPHGPPPASAVGYSQKRRAAPVDGRDRRSSFGRESISSRSSVSRMPKALRQISLGQKGFGIAAPKAAAAEVSAETVAASRVSAALLPPSSPAITPHMPSTPKMAAVASTADWPGPSSSLRPSTTSSADAGRRSQRDTPSRPIVIKNAQGSAGGGDLPLITPGSLRAVAALRSDEELPGGGDRDIWYSKALRAGDVQRLYTSKLLAEAVPELPKTLSPTAALAPWLVMVNPSKPEANLIDSATFNSRWQHVFPRPGEIRAMRWKTLCAPAAVPLTTEYFPPRAQFESEYQQQPYSVSQEADDDLLAEVPQTHEDLLRELVSLRLSQGFQVVIGPAVAQAFGQKQLKIGDLFGPEGRAGSHGSHGGHNSHNAHNCGIEPGASIFMSLGNTIHQLSCGTTSEVEINIFQRKTAGSSSNNNNSNNEGSTTRPMPVYRPAIRTLLDRDYETREIDIVAPRTERNWNFIDAYLAGHDEELTETLRFWRARFVLIPMSAKTAIPSAGDSEEELRLEGIRRLGQLWQKHRVVPPSERRFQNLGSSRRRRRKDTNPLDVVYKTDDPSLVIAAELETLPLVEGGEGTSGGGSAGASTGAAVRKNQLVTNGELFRKSSLSLALLAEAIQQPVESGGVRMQNRRWHLRLHYNCFIGSDMTSWLLDNFEDLESREDAEELGNMLMVSDESARWGEEGREKEKEESGSDSVSRREQGIFVHVEKRHPFRDGQYFYQISSDFAKPHAGSWFHNRRRETSVPSTPLAEPQREPSRSSLARPMSEDPGPAAPDTATTPTPTAPGKKPRVVLSKMIKLDVDPRRRSYRPERVDLHYDRLHNPDNCYHIRLEWMNVTAKLIEDAVESWARETLPYGLRLVEVPIAEACAIGEVNPFRRPYRIRLARRPPTQQPATYFDPNSLAPQQQPGRHFYQKALLRKFGFVLDVEAASNFPANVDVSYSWGRPDFRHTQYIHRLGIVLAQITDGGDFLLLANRLYSNRVVAPSQPRGESSQQPPSQQQQPPGTPLQSPKIKAKFNSPRLWPVGMDTPSKGAGLLINKNYAATTGATGTAGLSAAVAAVAAAAASAATRSVEPEAIKDELEAFCDDEAALELFYQETLLEKQQTRSVAATPQMGPTHVHSHGHAHAHVVVPDMSIPALGLPPGILSTSILEPSAESTNSRLSISHDAATASPSPRISSPAFLSSSRLFLRRSSVDDQGRQPE